MAFISFVAQNIQDALGNKLASGTLTVQPTDSNNHPITASANGTISTEPVILAVSNGAIPATAKIIDTSTTEPQNICLRITIYDAEGSPYFTLPLVQTGPLLNGATAFDLDTYQPNVPTQAVQQYGPSAYDLAVKNGFVGTVAQWLVSITGPMGQVSGPGMATAISKHDPVNLLALAGITYTAQIATQDGSVHIIPNDARFYATDYFVVPPGGTLIANAGTVTASGYPPFGYAFYDYNLNYISGASAAAGTVVQVPATAVYGRFSGNIGDTPIAQLMILANTATLPTSYVYPGMTVTASAAVSMAVASAAASSPAYGFVTNLFDPSRLQYQVQITTGSGQPYGIANDSRFYATGYFPVPAGGTLISNAATVTASGYPPFGYAFFDDKLNYISGSSATANQVVQVPATAVYAKFSAATTIGEPPLSAVMILPNTATMPTTYVYPGLPITASAALDQSSVLSNATLPAYGKKWYHVGDSISAIYGGGWLPQVVANTGIVQVGQDAHTGRDTQAIFEYYGLNAVGGTYTGPDPVNGIAEDPTAQGVQNVWADGVSRWEIAGKTLPQVLTAAAPDLITIYLGTNDTNTASQSMGSITDPSTANSYYGYLKLAIEGYMKAAPAARLMWIAPYKNVYSTLDSTTNAQPCVEAIKNTCRLYGVPVLDLDTDSGVNSLTFSTYLLSDSLHPNGNGDAMLARRFSAFINDLF